MNKNAIEDKLDTLYSKEQRLLSQISAKNHTLEEMFYALNAKEKDLINTLIMAADHEGHSKEYSACREYHEGMRVPKAAGYFGEALSLALEINRLNNKADNLSDEIDRLEIKLQRSK